MKNKHYLTILAIGALIFAIIYSWFSFAVIESGALQAGQRIFSWPDAMANNFFINNFIKSGSFVKEEPYNVSLQNIIHPRSTNIANTNIVPMSFLGMIIIYGWIGKVIGTKLILYLTPILASAAALFFYGLIRRVFNKKVGFISAILLLSLSSYWYFASLAMMHTILFVFLIISACYFYVRQIEKSDSITKNKLFSCLSGLLFGFALITRTIEFVWIGLIILIPFIFYYKKVTGKQILLFLLCLIIPFFILGFYNYQIYGEIFTTGYQNLQNDSFLQSLPSELQSKQSSSTLPGYLKLIFIPFGFHAKLILLNFYNYFISALWPYIILFVLGGLIILYKLYKKQISKRGKIYVWISLLTCAWLSFYYGSWQFIDQLVLKYNTISSSYTRYWLIMNILILPIIAYFLVKIWQFKCVKYLNYTFVALILALLCIFSANLVYNSKYDGLIAQKQVIETYYAQAQKVDQIIENNAIIITNRADKVFWPKRRVVMFNLDYSIFPIIKDVLDKTPVYYFTLMPDRDIDYINQQKINEFGLIFSEPMQIDEQFRLFKLKTIE